MSNPIPPRISFWQYINKSSPAWLICFAILALAFFVWGIHEIKVNDTWNVMVTAILFIVLIPSVFYIHWRLYLKGKQR